MIDPNKEKNDQILSQFKSKILQQMQNNFVKKQENQST